MEICDFPLMCYWDGEVLEQKGCVSYRGGNQCFILASSNMTYMELVDEIYKGIGIEKSSSELRVKMKFPSSGCFKVVPLNNEGAFKALFASIRHSNAPSMDIFVEVLTSHIVNPTPSIPTPPCFPTPSIRTPSIPIRLDDVAQFVSLETNGVNDGEFEGNLEGDEIDEELAALDEFFLSNEGDGDDDDDDLVFASAPIVEFNKLDPIDEVELNSWKTWENIVRHERGKEFAVGQLFPNKASVSDEVPTELKLHKVDKRGAHTRNWMVKHEAYIAMWERRGLYRFRGAEEGNEMHYNDPYMIWYRDRTRLFISPFSQVGQGPFSASQFLAQGFVNVHNTCYNELQQMPLEVPPHFRSIMSNLRDYSSQNLQQVGYSHLLPPTEEPTTEEAREEIMEDDVPLRQYHRRSKRPTTSMPSIEEQSTPEPSIGRRIMTRLRGKKKT